VIGWTLCSGIGAPEMAAPWVDWRLASEIEKFPRAVLQERLGYKTPDDHNQGDPLLWGDMTEVTPDLARSRGVPLPEIMIAGTPCQAFSIAGLRGGVDDARGNLTLKFVETCHAIVNARPDGKLAVLWENVPGVLSDKANAFGCFLGGLVGADDALSAPDGGSWPSVGMVSGPRARCAWRVLDAQYFGLAQRRRRVFVVVDFGGVIDPAAVLFERKSLRGDTPPSRKAGQGSARGFECGPSGGSFTELAPTLDARCKDGPIRNQIGAGALCEVSVFDPNQITSKTPAIAFDPNQITSKTNRSQPKPEQMHTLPATAIAPVLFQPQVRRLMPIECERLQGFPDNHTLIQYRNKDAADGPRYKALGNSMAVPCVAWIADRMKASMETSA
jgi:DNA (cytosine-5)-methyltransferase 1